MPTHEYILSKCFNFINMHHPVRANSILFDRAELICILHFIAAFVCLDFALCGLWLIEKQLIPSPFIHLFLFFWLYIFAQGHYSSRTVSQPGWKKSSGEMRWLCSVRWKSNLSLHLLTQSFLFYLTNIISAPCRKTKPLPLTVSQRVRRTKDTQTHLILSLTGSLQLRYSWIAGES